MRLKFIAVALSLACTKIAAHADTFQSFTLTATTVTRTDQTGTLDGTLNLDLDANLYTAAGAFDSTIDAVYTEGSTKIAFTGTNGGFGVANNSATYLIFKGQSDNFLNFFLPLNTGILAGYGGGPICSTSIAAVCDGSVTDIFSSLGGPDIDVTSGSLAPIVTPEPSPFVLLGTGLLSLTGALRRRSRIPL